MIDFNSLLLQVTKTVPNIFPKTTNYEIMIKALLDNPWLGLVVLIISLIGFPLGLFGIYSHYANKSVKRLSYNIRGFNLIDNKLTKVKGLKVIYNDTTINKLVVSKVMIWNSGNVTINGTDIVNKDKLRIEIVDGGVILDYSIVKEINQINEFNIKIDDSRRSIEISFEYLDKYDGVIIQLYHTGRSENEVKVKGTIKGIKSIFEGLAIGTESDYSLDDIKAQDLSFGLKLFLFFSPLFLPMLCFGLGWFAFSISEDDFDIKSMGLMLIFIGFFSIAMRIFHKIKRHPKDYNPYFKNF